MSMKSVTGFCLTLICTFLLAGFRPSITQPNIGDAVSDFHLRNVDGKFVSMGDYTNAKGVIVVFTCNHCPFAKLYQQRLDDLNAKYASAGYPLLAISASDASVLPEDSFENMVTRAKEKLYTFPYLYDESQEVALAFGAEKTPHAFVVKKENDRWILKYKGGIDDNGADPQKIKNKFVEDAVDALIAGKRITAAETKSIGCSIKWKNSIQGNMK